MTTDIVKAKVHIQRDCAALTRRICCLSGSCAGSRCLRLPDLTFTTYCQTVWSLSEAGEYVPAWENTRKQIQAQQDKVRVAGRYGLAIWRMK